MEAEPEAEELPKYHKWLKYKDPNYSKSIESAPSPPKRDWSKYKDPNYDPKKDPESQQYSPPEPKEDKSLWGKITSYIPEKIKPGNALSKQHFGDENLYGIAGRVLGRGAAALLGAPGDVANLATDFGSSLTNLVSGRGFKTSPEAQEIKNNQLFPTSEQLRTAFGGKEEHHATGTLGFMEDVASLASELAVLGGNIPKSISMALAGETTKSTAKWFGASKGTQEGLGLAAMALASLRSPGQAKKFADSLMEKATAKINIPTAPLPSAARRELKLATRKAASSFKVSQQALNTFKKEITDFRIAPNAESLVDIRRRLNDLYPQVKGSGGVNLHADLVKAVDGALESAAGGSPWLKEYKDAIHTQKIFHETRAAQESLGNGLKHLVKSPTAHALAVALHWLPKSIIKGATFGGPALASGVGAGLGARSAVNRIIKSPSLRKHYDTAFKAFLARNTPGTINALTKLAKEMEKDQEEDK